MKKTLLALATLLTVFALTGCSASERALYNQYKDELEAEGIDIRTLSEEEIDELISRIEDKQEPAVEEIPEVDKSARAAETTLPAAEKKTVSSIEQELLLPEAPAVQEVVVTPEVISIPVEEEITNLFERDSSDSANQEAVEEIFVSHQQPSAATYQDVIGEVAVGDKITLNDVEWWVISADEDTVELLLYAPTLGEGPWKTKYEKAEVVAEEIKSSTGLLDVSSRFLVKEELGNISYSMLYIATGLICEGFGPTCVTFDGEGCLVTVGDGGYSGHSYAYNREDRRWAFRPVIVINNQ